MEDLRLNTYWSHVARVVSRRSLQREIERAKQQRKRGKSCTRRPRM